MQLGNELDIAKEIALPKLRPDIEKKGIPGVVEETDHESRHYRESEMWPVVHVSSHANVKTRRRIGSEAAQHQEWNTLIYMYIQRHQIIQMYMDL